jgi:hypothetical protein
MNPFSGAVNLADLREIKAKYESELLAKANVVAVGIGMPVRDGVPRGEPGIVVSVTHKVHASELAPEDLIPKSLEGVRVWVEEIDLPRAMHSVHEGER